MADCTTTSSANHHIVMSLMTFRFIIAVSSMIVVVSGSSISQGDNSANVETVCQRIETLPFLNRCMATNRNGLINEFYYFVLSRPKFDENLRSHASADVVQALFSFFEVPSNVQVQFLSEALPLDYYFWDLLRYELQDAIIQELIELKDMKFRPRASRLDQITKTVSGRFFKKFNAILDQHVMSYLRDFKALQIVYEKIRKAEDESLIEHTTFNEISEVSDSYFLNEKRKLFVSEFISNILPKVLNNFVGTLLRSNQKDIAAYVGTQATGLSIFKRTLMDWDGRLVQESDWHLLLAPVLEDSHLHLKRILESNKTPSLSKNSVEYGWLYNVFCAVRHRQIAMKYSNQMEFDCHSYLHEVADLYQFLCPVELARFVYRFDSYEKRMYLEPQVRPEDHMGFGRNHMFEDFIEQLTNWQKQIDDSQDSLETVDDDVNDFLKFQFSEMNNEQKTKLLDYLTPAIIEDSVVEVMGLSEPELLKRLTYLQEEMGVSDQTTIKIMMPFLGKPEKEVLNDLNCMIKLAYKKLGINENDDEADSDGYRSCESVIGDGEEWLESSEGPFSDDDVEEVTGFNEQADSNDYQSCKSGIHDDEEGSESSEDSYWNDWWGSQKGYSDDDEDSMSLTCDDEPETTPSSSSVVRFFKLL